MSVCVSAGDCARQLVRAVEQKMEGALHHGGQQGNRISVPLFVPLDIYRENNGNTWVVLEVPGAKRDSIMVNLNQDQNLLTISGLMEKPRPLQQDGNFTHREGAFGYFVREVQVPKNLKENEIKAKYNEGILLVEIPETKGNKGVAVKVEA